MKDSFVVLPGGKPTINKPASAVKVYGADLVDVLGEGDSIATVSCTVDGVALAGQAAFAGTVVKALIGGGTPGQIASARFDFTTALGTTDNAVIYFRIIPG